MKYSLRTLTPTPHLLHASPDAGADAIRFSKQLAVLIYLAARPAQRASREELTGLLWGGSSSLDARQALRQVVYQLRHSTEPDLLRGDEVLSLRPGAVEFDVDLFRGRLGEGRLEEALEIYEADFLATVSLPGAREFEHWAEGLRQQLAAERRQIFRTLIARRTDEGRWQDAARLAEQLADADPADLEPRIRRVELLTLAGDAVRAAGAADEARRLAAERQVEHSNSAVEQAIARALAAHAAPERRPSNGFPRHPEMVGRATEFRRVVDAWKSAQQGRGGAVLLSGEAGIGKTRLTRELERRFQRDRALIVRTACYAIEQSDPFGPFLDALRALHAAPGLAGAAPACLEVLAALLPEIAERFAAAVRPRPVPIPPQAIAASLADAFAAVADEAPLVLIVEDLHWAPPGTAEFAHRLARRAASTHLLLVLTARDFGGSPATMRALRDLSASGAASMGAASDAAVNDGAVSDGAVSETVLWPLDCTDVEHLLASMAQLPPGDAGSILVRRVHAATDGIPLYVLEVLKTLHDAGGLSVKDDAWQVSPVLCDEMRPLRVPASTDAILGTRLATLGEHPSAVLTALAVVGRAAAVEDLVRITGLEKDEVRAAARVLERRRLIGRSNGSVDNWSVAHDELAAAALRSAPSAFVELYHARAADLAEERASQGVPTAFAPAALHAGRAGDGLRAAVSAARAVAQIENVAGQEAGRGALSVLLESMPAVVRSDVARSLRRVVEGQWTARRWLDERDGTRRRRRWRMAVAAVASVALLASGLAAVVASHHPPGPLGGGYIALSSPSGNPRPADVRAYRVAPDLTLHEVGTDLLPPGLRAGFQAAAVRPDQRLAALPCTRPDIDPVVACVQDLATGHTTVLARFVSDAHINSWLPDGSGFVMDGGDTLPGGRYFRSLLLRDSAGRDVRVLARDPPRSYPTGIVSPRGDRVLAIWTNGDSAGAELRSIEGDLLGAIDWCGEASQAWSPDAARLACRGLDDRTLAVGEASPGSTARRFNLPGPISSVAWSPDGRFIALTVLSAGTQLYLLDGQTLEAPVPVGPRLAPERKILGWSATVLALPPARIVVTPRRMAASPGSRVAVQVSAFDAKGRLQSLPSYLKWRVADSTIARVSDSGVVTADRPGTTWLYVVPGLRAADSVPITVGAPVIRQSGREDFEHGLDTARWKPFGRPAPRVLAGRGLQGSSGFNNNGDISHSSGVAFRTMLDLSRGLTVEWWSRVPFTGAEWQGTATQLSDVPPDSFRLGEGDPVRGSRGVIAADGPTSNGRPRTLSLSATGAEGAIAGLPSRLADGAWHRYRLVVYASGEVRWFGDGVELVRPVRADLRRLPRATLVIQGQSYRTLVMVDEVTVWEGVVLEPAVLGSDPRVRVNPAGGPARRAGQGGPQ